MMIFFKESWCTFLVYSYLFCNTSLKRANIVQSLFFCRWKIICFTIAFLYSQFEKFFSLIIVICVTSKAGLLHWNATKLIIFTMCVHTAFMLYNYVVTDFVKVFQTSSEFNIRINFSEHTIKKNKIFCN